jgi:hypothetical protein
VILNAWVSVEDGTPTTATATFTPGTAVARPSSIRWGHSASTVAAEPFPFRLIGANIHYGDGTAQVNGFFANPAIYRQIPVADSRALAMQLGVSQYDPTLGALLRFDPGFMRPCGAGTARAGRTVLPSARSCRWSTKRSR